MPATPTKHECSDCGKKNAVGKARLCPTCRRRHSKASREKAHDRMVLTKYGITGDMYRYLYERQGGRCPICQVATGKSKRLAVDHNHQTNAVRGLLCGSCNHKLLGGAHESVEVLQRAIDYLIDPPAYRYLREYSDETASA